MKEGIFMVLLDVLIIAMCAYTSNWIAVIGWFIVLMYSIKDLVEDE